MADQILFDKLAYIDRLKRGGVDDNQARAHAEAMDGALRESVATKPDLGGLENNIRSEISGLEINIKSEINRLETKITRLETKLEAEVARLETKISVRDVTIRIGAMLVALFAALASIKFFG
jgi:predicted  nucleic acid-binding Zn-ribbon protein